MPEGASRMVDTFFMIVISAEEPGDYMQRVILRAGEQVHPLVGRIMAIHVAEESRHISFAHDS